MRVFRESQQTHISVAAPTSWRVILSCLYSPLLAAKCCPPKRPWWMARWRKKADKAKRTAHASACMIRKGFPHFPPAIITSPESGIITAPHPQNNAFVMMAAHCLFRGLDDSLTIIFSMLCRNLSPKPTADS
ncbi:serine/threonine-protein kinase HSL1,negative regulator of Swe1 kinase [Trypanosoma cruzi]|nr:serine/threonine-protein kinase HSL1,negative regulator of Swe1 kinase [Trypanosoma cruzi]